jgi:hypothetical protein
MNVSRKRLRRSSSTSLEEAEAVRRQLEEAGLTGNVSKEELLARARAKGLIQ